MILRHESEETMVNASRSRTSEVIPTMHAQLGACLACHNPEKLQHHCGEALGLAQGSDLDQVTVAVNNPRPSNQAENFLNPGSNSRS